MVGLRDSWSQPMTHDLAVPHHIGALRIRIVFRVPLKGPIRDL